MMAMGNGCQMALQAADPDTPTVHWSRKLTGRAAQQGYDLVVASYVLAELRTPGERRRAVAQLWGRTSPRGALLLVEPGTPIGSANVREARTQILAAECGGIGGEASPTASTSRDAGREASSSAAADGSPAATGGSPAATGSSPTETRGFLAAKGGSSVVAGSSLVATGRSPAVAGAHVVAPCPHDGRCPMDGTDSWCHFAQRFRRTTALKRTKTLQGGKKPRDYQDERFSYVILRRGPRPARAAPTRIIAPKPAGPYDGLDLTPEELAELQSENRHAQAAEESEEEGTIATAAKGEQPPVTPDEETLALILESMRDAGSEDDEDSDAEDAQAAFLKELRGAGADEADEEESVGAEQLQIVAPSDDDAITFDLSKTVAPSRGYRDSLGEDSEGEDEGEEESLDPADVALAVAASSSWSRLIRPPRKKTRHVLLDVCSAGGPGAGKRGLQQVVVSKQGEGPLYRFARKLRWGDLWPEQRK